MSHPNQENQQNNQLPDFSVGRVQKSPKIDPESRPMPGNTYSWSGDRDTSSNASPRVNSRRNMSLSAQISAMLQSSRRSKSAESDEDGNF